VRIRASIVVSAPHLYRIRVTTAAPVFLAVKGQALLTPQALKSKTLTTRVAAFVANTSGEAVCQSFIE
jgi:hypothetical protein